VIATILEAAATEQEQRSDRRGGPELGTAITFLRRRG
jgi:hypothetical protein